MRPTHAADILKAAELPALLVTNLMNIRYVSGLPVTAGVLLVHGRAITLFVDARYTDMASRAYSSVKVRSVNDLEKMMAAVEMCGFESDDVTVHRKSAWKKRFPKTTFVAKNGIIEQFRRSKSEEEIKLLKRAHRITKELLRRVPAVIRRPVTEEQLARRLQIWALELGADGLSFDPIVAFGSHTACPHHRPTSRVLKKGHLVQIDVGARVGGYCADMSQVYFTVEPTALQKRVYNTILEAMGTAMQLAKKGASTRSLDRAARAVLDREGLDEFFVHALGHGVGLDIHEGPTLSSKARDEQMLAGEVFAVEPGVYFPGKFGMRVEDMVYIA